MTVYTKTGDKGTTALFGGKRVSKDDHQIQAYGNVDELSVVIGMVMLQDIDSDDVAFLTNVQHNLYHLMSVLCGAEVGIKRIESHTLEIEKRIDEMEDDLPKLSKFILPQGTSASVWFHVARTVCRRAERAVVAMIKEKDTIELKKKHVMLQYLNRLSDAFFVYARKYNEGEDVYA